MRPIQIARVLALLFALNILTLASQNRSSNTQALGRVNGTVTDLAEARVAGATITIEGEGLTRAVITSDEGKYMLELPAGTYRIGVARSGFCPESRAAFRIMESADTKLNFALIPCPIVNALTITNGKYEGETDQYAEPFKKEIFLVPGSPDAKLELLVRYGSRQEFQNTIRFGGSSVSYDSSDAGTRSVRREKYLGAQITYDSLMIRADRFDLDPKTLKAKAEGNVVVEQGEQRTQGTSAVVHFEAGKPFVKVSQ